MADDDNTKRGAWFWIAVFFGAGLVPKAPGTMGTLASLVIWAPVVLLDVDPLIRFALAVVITVIGTVASGHAARIIGKDDPGAVVIDEVAGQGFTLVFAAAMPLSVVVGFLLFRLFDIWKPWPVRVADRKIKGGLGIMLDDVIAGVMAAGVLELIEWQVYPLLSGVL